ncbi:MAG: DEAD/DEAH box helicase [Candidatus Syntrophosphaera sp.]|nr:DEAD/DEAH box helicase [Candidatus Syntrophosphaera sp.]
MTKFTDITLPEPLLRAAADLNYETPTPIQDQVIPWLLENDNDLIALAQTGTGKTAAFGFPILSQTDIEKPTVQNLIICPTRELCLQITKDLESYAKYIPRIKTAAVYGGASLQKQKDAIKAGLHIVVGTPGRINDFIRQNVLKLDQVGRLVLDEADEMLNMGFKDDLFEIMGHTPAEKQILLFSATMPKEVANLARTFMKDPHQISVGNQNQGADNISHFYYKVHARDKYKALKRIADMSPKIYGIIFCRTRAETQEIADKLQHDGYNADALHGDLSQGQRELVMSRFRTKYVRLLVATDVAARGLDVDNLTHIINFSAPTDPDIYIHRSGRTGRAGKSGISATIIHTKEIAALKAMEKRLGREITLAKVPGGREICEKQLFQFIDTVERIEVDTAQIESFLPNVYKKLSWLTREELIQRFVSVEFNRFLNYYKDISDLDTVGDISSREEKRSFAFKTFKLGIGYSKQLTKRELMRYINQLKVTRSLEIGQIDIYPEHTLVELDAEFENQLLKAFSRNKYKGVAFRAEVVESARRKRFTKDEHRSVAPNKARKYQGWAEG